MQIRIRKALYTVIRYRYLFTYIFFLKEIDESAVNTSVEEAAPAKEEEEKEKKEQEEEVNKQFVVFMVPAHLYQQL
jgi:hypothetical protein